MGVVFLDIVDEGIVRRLRKCFCHFAYKKGLYLFRYAWLVHHLVNGSFKVAILLLARYSINVKQVEVIPEFFGNTRGVGNVGVFEREGIPPVGYQVLLFLFGRKVLGGFGWYFRKYYLRGQKVALGVDKVLNNFIVVAFERLFFFCKKSGKLILDRIAAKKFVDCIALLVVVASFVQKFIVNLIFFRLYNPHAVGQPFQGC